MSENNIKSKLNILKEQVKEQVEEKRKIYVEEGKKIIREGFREFMEANPTIRAFKWEQYTPYFNDGDACYFSEPSFLIEDIPDDWGDREDGWVSAYDYEYGCREDENVNFSKTLYKNMEDLSGLLCSNEDILEHLFGDHVQVTYSRGSDEVEVEDYNHD